MDTKVVWSLVTLGISHNTAPVYIREKVAFSKEQQNKALKQLVEIPQIDEAVILSTCNRTELYCHSNGNDVSHSIAQWISDFHAIDLGEFEKHSYIYYDDSVVRHAFNVAAGLDSMVIGENQILGQLKDAYHAANNAGTLGKELEKLFQHAFLTAKQVRTNTAIGSNPVSVAYAAVNLAQQFFDTLKDKNVLLVGAGETIALVAKHLEKQGVGNIIISNRSLESAKQLANSFAASVTTLDKVQNVLPNIDIVVTSTSSSIPVIGKGAVENAIKKRKHKPMYMVDLAVPRDIEPQVTELDDVYLYTIDDLESIIKDNLSSRKNAIDEAKSIIDFRVEQHIRKERARNAFNIIKNYRKKSEIIRDETLKKANDLVRQGKPIHEVLEFLSYTLTNKLTHVPTQTLNEAGQEDKKELLSVACKILGIRDSEE
jgi:glutamyl-tRNA reductase